jgi:glycine cleavage system H protein
MTRPAELKYSPSHEWTRIEDGIATVGITDFAVEQLGDLVFIDLPAGSETVARGAPFGEIESTKSASELFVPLSGEITEVNSELADNLGALADDPFGAGWMIRIRISTPEEESELIDLQQYEELLAQEDEH